MIFILKIKKYLFDIDVSRYSHEVKMLFIYHNEHCYATGLEDKHILRIKQHTKFLLKRN